MLREEPTEGNPDSGWRFMAGNEDDEYMDNPDNHHVFALNTICNYDLSLIHIYTNRIPYNFAPLSVNDYFNDCAEDIEMELDSKNVEFGYFNYVEGDQKIIADPEQLKSCLLYTSRCV